MISKLLSKSTFHLLTRNLLSSSVRISKFDILLSKSALFNYQHRSITQKNSYFMSSQQSQDDQDLKQQIKQAKMKLKMDMEFQSSTMVEENCYGLYPIIVEDGTSQDALDLGKTMVEYAEKKEKELSSEKQQIIHKLNLQVIRCYGHISIAFSYLKNDDNLKAEQEISLIEKEFQNFESKLNNDQRFLIVCHIIRVLSLVEKEGKCKNLVKYVIDEIKISSQQLDRWDDGEFEMAYKTLHFYAMSLIHQKKGDTLRELIEDSQFLNIEYLSNSESLPIAFPSIGNLFSCLGLYFQQIGEKEKAQQYLQFAADLYEQLEGKDSPNFLFIQSQFESFKGIQ